MSRSYQLTRRNTDPRGRTKTMAESEDHENFGVGVWCPYATDGSRRFHIQVKAENPYEYDLILDDDAAAEITARVLAAPGTTPRIINMLQRREGLPYDSQQRLRQIIVGLLAVKEN